MAEATLAALVFDQGGTLAMIVLPDTDAQLNDPAFNPSGMIHVRVPLAGYQSCKTHADVLNLAQPLVAKTSPTAGASITQNIATITAQPVISNPLTAAQLSAQAAQREQYLAARVFNPTLTYQAWAAAQVSVGPTL